MDKLKTEAFQEKNQMLSNMKSIILSTVDQRGKPNASYAPSVIDENGSFFIYISTLSKHTQNLLNNSKVSMMIIEDETNSENLFARKRFTIKGKSEALNEMLKYTKYNWIALLDVDDKWLPQKLESQITYMNNLLFVFDRISYVSLILFL